jgi:hypothetical protein
MNNIFNTKKGGVVRTIIFKNGRSFKAVCLDFDIIEEAKTSREAEKQIKEAIIGYIKNIYKNKLDDALLNRPAEKKYWDMYNQYIEVLAEKNKKKNVSNFSKMANASIFTMPINSSAMCQV